MPAIKNFVQGLLLAFAFLISFNAVSALPTGEAGKIEARTMHTCSVFVQRWCQDCNSRFDVAYFDTMYSPAFTWSAPAWWNQESEAANTPSPGSELVPIQVGSNILHITNVADPTSSSDPGKLSFTWGNQSWDTFSAGSPCDVVPVGNNAQFGGSTNYECHYLCDH